MIELFNFNFSILEFVILPLSVLLLPALTFGPRPKVRCKGLLELHYAAAYLLLVSIVLSSFGAIDQRAVWVRGLGKWLEVFGVSLAVFVYCRSVRQVRHVWLLIIVASILSGIGGFYLNFWRQYSAGGFGGLPVSAVALAAARRLPGYSAVSVLALVLPWADRGRLRRLLVALLLFVALASLSKGAILTLVAVLAYYFYGQKGYRPRMRGFPATRIYLILFVVLAGVAVAAMWLPGVQGILALRFGELKTVGLSLRVSLLEAAARAFMDRPLTGVGAENYAEYLIARGAYPPGHQITPNLAPHNLFFQVAAENGILGILALALWFLTLYVMLFRRRASAAMSRWVLSLRLYLIVQFVGAGLLSYVSGSGRMELGLFVGLSCASLRVFGKDKPT